MSVVLKEINNGVATIYLNRPEQRNAISTELLSELIKAVRECKEDDKVRAIVLTGKGKSFCAGGDLKEFISERQEEKSTFDIYQQRKKLVEFFELQFSLGKPTIAAVNGHALAGGFGLALSCDFVISSDEALMGTTEIDRGLFPMMIMAVIFRYAPRRKAMEYIFTGDMFKATKALEDGLINKVVPKEQVLLEAYELANRLASKSMSTFSLGKDAYYTMMDMDVHHALRYLQSMLVVNLGIKDAGEGIDSFLEKRDPMWSDQ